MKSLVESLMIGERRNILLITENLLEKLLSFWLRELIILGEGICCEDVIFICSDIAHS